MFVTIENLLIFQNIASEFNFHLQNTFDIKYSCLTAHDIFDFPHFQTFEKPLWYCLSWTLKRQTFLLLCCLHNLRIFQVILRDSVQITWKISRLCKQQSNKSWVTIFKSCQVKAFDFLWLHHHFQLQHTFDTKYMSKKIRFP